MIILKYRKKEPFPSFGWLKLWLKRFCSYPSLLRLQVSKIVLQLRGVEIGFFSDICGANIAGNLSYLSIGSFSFVGRVDIVLHDKLSIHSNVVINDHVKILTGSHDVDSVIFENTKSPIVIEDYAWICTGAIILPGVTIGRGAVVAAGSVVSKDVAPYTVVGGSPAHFIKHRKKQNFSYCPNLLRACYECWLDINKLLL